MFLVGLQGDLETIQLPELKATCPMLTLEHMTPSAMPLPLPISPRDPIPVSTVSESPATSDCLLQMPSPEFPDPKPVAIACLSENFPVNLG